MKGTGNVIGTFSYPMEFQPIIDGLKVIAARERKAMASLIRELIAEYVKTHGDGNPSYEISKWIEQPEFVADPAVRETKETWYRYMEQCTEQEVSQLEGLFMQRTQMARDAWKRKKYNR